MYLRCHQRIKNGKKHCYWNIVESKRCAGGKVVQRQVLYLGEINDSQREAWCRVIEAFDEETQQSRQPALFPADPVVQSILATEYRGLRLSAQRQPQLIEASLPRASRETSCARPSAAGHVPFRTDGCAAPARNAP